MLAILHFFLPRASAATFDFVHEVVRKSGHVTEYFIFSLLLLRAVRGPERGWKLRWALVALLIAALYAASDETHQIFVPGRGPSVWDVLLDTASAAVAQMAAWRFIAPRKHRSSEPEPAFVRKS